MSAHLQEVEARRASIEELGGVVDAMRALAAVRLQQAGAALAGTRAYADVVGAAFAEAVAAAGREVSPQRAETRTGIVVFGAEHGFVGAFNEPLRQAVAGRGRGRGRAAQLMVIGSRAASLFAEHGAEPDWSLDMATQPSGVMAVARRVADHLYTDAFRALGRIDLVYRRHPGGAVVSRRLLPVEPPPGPARAAPPLLGLPAPLLAARLADEYLFAELAHAAMESFAAENAARLSVMLSASHNIDDRLAELTALARQLLQDSVTTEIADLALTALE